MTIHRADLEALAKVMGGEVGSTGVVWNIGKVRCIIWREGVYSPGTLESLHAKLREWADADPGKRFLNTTYLGKGRHYINPYDEECGVPNNFSGTELECLVAAVLWAYGGKEER